MIIALVAHDNKKQELMNWIRQHQTKFQAHELYATGSTGKLIQQNLKLNVTLLESGPLGGDQQLGAMIVEGKIDLLFFFSDPLEAQPHDPDVRALLRLSVVWNVPMACNCATADYIITSPLFASDYKCKKPDYSNYRQRKL